ncbi:MAG: sigma-70 family RNA polymerase sigma factor [Tepidisphaeraceae bacterium]
MLEKPGKEATWASLLAEQIRQNGRLFFRLAFGILRNTASAEDVCQQAFSRAWERRGKIEDSESLCGWLAKVVINESLAIARRRKAEQRALSTRAELDRALSNVQQDETELRESVLAALDRLPETPRLVIALRLMRGMSGNEVKVILGCSASEVSRQLYLGMEMLRELLAEWEAAPK